MINYSKSIIKKDNHIELDPLIVICNVMLRVIITVMLHMIHYVIHLYHYKKASTMSHKNHKPLSVQKDHKITANHCGKT